MTIIEVAFRIACPDAIADSVVEYARGEKIADVIAGHIANEVDSDMISVEAKDTPVKRYVSP